MQEVEQCLTCTAQPLEELIGNIKKSEQLGLANICDTNWWRMGESIAIVGGGPSLKDNLETLRKYEYIMACGSVYDYLWEQGIKPTWCVLVDPDAIITKSYLKHADGATTYLVASQCPPEMFEYLKEFNVCTWHADGAIIENKSEVFGEGVKLVGGGCTVGTRAMVLALGMGFNCQDLFGFDNCITNTYEHHAYPFNDPDTETLGNIVEIKVGGPNSPTFKVAEYMLAQLFDFKNILNAFANVLRIRVFGTGVLAYVMEQANKANSEVKEVISNG